MYRRNNLIRCCMAAFAVVILALAGGQGGGCIPPPVEPQCFQEAPPFNGGVLVTMDGSRSFRSDGAGLSYNWAQLAGTPVTLSNPSGVITTFTAPYTNETLRFRLMVTDSAGESDTCEGTV